MRTLYLRHVPDDVVARLERLADHDGISLSAAAIRELTDVSRRADNPALLDGLPTTALTTTELLAHLAQPTQPTPATRGAPLAPLTHADARETTPRHMPS